MPKICLSIYQAIQERPEDFLAVLITQSPISQKHDTMLLSPQSQSLLLSQSIEEISISFVDQSLQENVSPPSTPAELTKNERERAWKQETKEQRAKITIDRPYREKGSYKQKGEYRGERRGEVRRSYNNRGELQRTYKPKYQEKPQKRVQAINQHSDSESEEGARNFKRHEIEKLQEEGFTVVGKPKPKARDQVNVYAHQHGRKQGHHNVKHR